MATDISVTPSQTGPTAPVPGDPPAADGAAAMSGSLALVFSEITLERCRQDSLFGEQNHDIFTWLAILGEEVGEVARAALEARFDQGSPEHLREELVQVAAVAAAMLQCMDRLGPEQFCHR